MTSFRRPVAAFMAQEGKGGGAGGPAAIARVEPAAEPARASRRLRVVIIDDEPEPIKILRRLLRNSEVVNADTTISVDTAFDLIKSAKPDVAVLDLNFNGPIAGALLAERIRADKDLTGIKLLLCSGTVRDLDEKAPGKKQLFDAIFNKVDFDKLAAYITALQQSADPEPK